MPGMFSLTTEQTSGCSTQTDQALERRETRDGGELGPESLTGVMVTQVS